MAVCLKGNMAKIEDPTVENGKVDGFDEKVKEAFPTPVRYACMHWVSHLAAAEQKNGQVEVLLRDFLCHHLLHWIEAMSLLGSIPQAIDMMSEAHIWAVCSGRSG